MFFTAPVPDFEFPVYSVEESDRSVELCITTDQTISEAVTYTITAIQKSPPQAEGAKTHTWTHICKHTCKYTHTNTVVNSKLLILLQMLILVQVPV